MAGYDGFDEALDDFRSNLEWRDATDLEKTLVLGNLNGFVSHLRAMGYVPYKPRQHPANCFCADCD